ncbi:hypothetical protein SCHPADRAFT_928062 [Schizopora paradoxa]|uniref:F-box domain-containing protein n=1 Tax=Schizopora paradoxa TaxID=27342 RepID=A0A0H2RXB9_9AGAM|nr:hypothetical protein SCHPADRAFT_928062 [Schizopora paradoxa]
MIITILDIGLPSARNSTVQGRCKVIYALNYSVLGILQCQFYKFHKKSVKKSTHGSRRANAHVTQNAPIFSLNEDLLLEIFEYGLIGNSIHASGISLPEETFVLACSQVCRLWRTLTLSKQNLWSTITWDSPDPNKYTDKRFSLLWDIYLSRSGKASLSVLFYSNHRSKSKTRERIFKSIFDEQHRLKHLVLHGEQEVMPEGEKYLLNSATKLEMLYIDVFNFIPLEPEEQTASIIVDLTNLRKLQDLSLSGNIIVNRRENVLGSLRLAVVRTNEIMRGNARRPLAGTWSTKRWFSFLRYVPHIEELAIMIHTANIVSSNAERLKLKNLHKLHINLKAGDIQALDSLFRNMVLPALTTLELVFSDDARHLGQWSKSCALKTVQTLTLRCWKPDVFFDEEEELGMQSLVRCMPVLKNLEVVADFISSQTISFLTLRPTDSTVDNVCPELRQLTIVQLGSDEGLAARRVSNQAIVDLVVSRCRRPQGSHEMGNQPQDGKIVRLIDGRTRILCPLNGILSFSYQRFHRKRGSLSRLVSSCAASYSHREYVKSKTWKGESSQERFFPESPLQRTQEWLQVRHLNNEIDCRLPIPDQPLAAFFVPRHEYSRSSAFTVSAGKSKSTCASDQSPTPEHMRVLVSRSSRSFTKRRIRRSGLNSEKENDTQTAPIFSLNADILLEIFELGIRSYSKDRPGGIFVLCCSLVCRSWRALALAHPSLWASIFLDSKRYSDKRFLSLWGLYLSRSGRAPLSVRFCLDDRDTFRTRERILDSIFAEQHRLKYLDLYGERRSLPDGRAYLLNAATRLKSLSVYIYNAHLTVPDASSGAVVIDLSDLRSLQDVSLSGDINVTIFEKRQPNVLSSLRVAALWTNDILRGDTPHSLTWSTTRISSFLQNVPSIENLAFMIHVADIVAPSAERLSLNRLHSLSITTNDGDIEAPDSLFRNLELPALTRLDLMFMGQARHLGRWNDCSALKTVKTLIFRCTKANEVPDTEEELGLRSLLQFMPKLQSLLLEASWITSRTFSVLTLRLSGGSGDDRRHIGSPLKQSSTWLLHVGDDHKEARMNCRKTKNHQVSMFISG